jgi:hypothetical protein
MVKVLDICTNMDGMSDGKPTKPCPLDPRIEKDDSMTPFNRVVDILGQAQMFASIVIQAHWRGFSCRKKKIILCVSFSSNNKGPCTNLGTEEVKQSMNDTSEAKRQSVTNKLTRGLKSSSEKEGKAKTSITKYSNMKKRVVKKVPCVTLNLEAIAVPQTVSSTLPSKMKGDATVRQEPRCFSSQSHQRVSSNYARPNNTKDSRPKTASVPQPRVVHSRKAARGVTPSSSSASTRLESAINSFLQNQRKEPSAAPHQQVTADDSSHNNLTLEPPAGLAAPETHSETVPTDRFGALLLKLRSLNNM